MSEARDNVLDKLDALLKKHAATEPDIPVLTDILEPPRIDLGAIPVLTEEVASTPLQALQDTPLELDLVPEPVHDDTVPRQTETETVLARLEAVEAEVQADIDARIARAQSVPDHAPSIEIPPHAHYVPLPLTQMIEPSVPPAMLPEETIKKIAELIEADIARVLKTSLHQALSQELDGMLNNALDKALSSMLDQFMIHMEDVVRNSIADELQKQLAPFKRPAPTNKS